MKLILSVVLAFFALLQFSAAKPNIIFILCDDLGYGDLGVLFQNGRDSERKHVTANLDRFAAEGMQMRRHYCPAPVCAPSRASLLTGFHQGHENIRNNQFDKALAGGYTLPGVLKSVGYRTAIVGKYGLQGEGDSAQTWPAYPTKRGFDEFFGVVSHRAGHLHYPAHDWPMGNSDAHRSKVEIWHNAKEISGDLDKCYTTDLYTAYAKKWITDSVRDAPADPFFLYLAYDAPHAALQLPTSAYPEGGGLSGGLQWTGEPHRMINTARGEIDSYVYPEHSGWTNLEQRQAAMIRRIDEAVGDLQLLLKDLGIDENTLVVFSSDNGPHKESYIEGASYNADLFQAYGPFDGIKRDTYEGGIRVPTLVRWPERVNAGGIDRTPSQFHDWMNTFLDAAGAPLLAQSDGVSLLPALTGEGEQAIATTYIEYQNGGKMPTYKDFAQEHQGRKRGEMQVLFLDGFKGLRYNLKNPGEPFEIYDVEKDPGEENNLAGTSPKFDALEKKMQEKVLRIRRPNAEAIRPYDSEPVPALDGVPPGAGKFRITFTPGEFPWVPASFRTDETTEVMQEGLAFSPASSGVVEIEGYFEVSKTGDYEVSLESPGAAVLHIHQALAISAGTRGEVSSSSIKLGAGIHPFLLRYLSSGPVATLALSGAGEVTF